MVSFNVHWYLEKNDKKCRNNYIFQQILLLKYKYNIYDIFYRDISQVIMVIKVISIIIITYVMWLGYRAFKIVQNMSCILEAENE